MKIVNMILYGMNIMKNKSKMIVDEDGDKVWKLPNGDLHREDGPAVEYANGNKWWYLNGKKHREDSPAIEWANGYYKAWYLNDRLYKIQLNNKIIKRDKDFDCNTCISEIVCDIDCQEDIMWKEYDEKRIKN